MRSISSLLVILLLYVCTCGYAFTCTLRVHPFKANTDNTATCWITQQPPPFYRDSCLQMNAKGFGAKASFKYAGNLRPGKLSNAFPVPKDIGRPDYAIDGIPKLGKQKGRQVCPRLILCLYFLCLSVSVFIY